MKKTLTLSTDFLKKPARFLCTAMLLLAVLVTTGTHNAYAIGAPRTGSADTSAAVNASHAFEQVKTAQTIIFNAIPAKTYGDADFAALAFATSALPISYTSSNTAVATISGGNIHIVGAGTATITASQAGNSSYDAAANVVQTLTVNQLTIYISPDNNGKVYGKRDPQVTYTYNPALVGSDDFTKIAPFSRAPGEAVGTYEYNQNTLKLNNNYKLIWGTGQLTIIEKTILINANSFTKYEGDPDPTLTYTLSEPLPAGFTFTLTRTPGEAAGQYGIELSNVVINANYKLKLAKVASLTILPASAHTDLSALTLSTGVLSPAFNKDELNYSLGVPNAVKSITIRPKAADPAATVTVNGASPATAVPLTEGPNAIPVKVNAANGTSKTYTVVVTRRSLSSKPDQTITFNSIPAKTYGDAYFAAGATASSGLPISYTSSNTAVATISGGNIYMVGAGSATITASQAGNSSYDAAANVVQTLTVNKYNVSIYVFNRGKVYGDAEREIDYATPFLIRGDKIISGSLSRSPGEDVGTYSINVNTLTAGNNYNLYITPGQYFSITPKSIQIIPDDKVKIHGDPDPPLTFTTSGPLPAGVTFEGSLDRASGEAIGIYEIRPGLLRTSNTNYTPKLAKAAYLTIIPALTSTDLSALSLSAGTLSPAFNKDKLNYSVSVANTVSSITLNPVAADPAATVTVSGTSPATAVPLAVGINTIPVVVTTTAGATKTYTVAVTRAASGSTYLPSIKLATPSALVTKTGNAPKTYTASVPYAASSIKVLPTASDSYAVIRVEGQVVASGTVSQAVPLQTGANTIHVVVTAQNGTTEPYTITVTRAVSDITKIKLAMAEPITALRETDSTRRNFTTSVDPAITSVRLTPIAADTNATITIGGNVVASGTASQPLPLQAIAAGPTLVSVNVTAPDGHTKATYTVTINRKGSNNTYLPSFKLVNPGTTLLKISNTPKVYTAVVANTATSIRVLATARDANAVIKVEGVVVPSGAISQPIPLNIGANIIHVVVAAQDGVSIEPYTVTVTRLAPPTLAAIGNNKNQIDVVQKPEPTADALPEQITVKQAVSPNGDGINDRFTIAGINAFPTNTVSIMNRNGDVIYEAKGYDNESKAFDGRSSKGIMQQAGTYFYSIEYKKGTETLRKTGYLILKY